MAEGNSSQKGLQHYRETHTGQKGGPVKAHQDVQQHQALASGCPLPEVYGVLEFADGCKGDLERHSTLVSGRTVHAPGCLSFVRPQMLLNRNWSLPYEPYAAGMTM